MKHPIAKYQCLGGDNIVFYERDAREVRQPHDNPLVIMLTIEEYNIRKVLVDNGSSTDVIYMMAYQQMKLDPK